MFNVLKYWHTHLKAEEMRLLMKFEAKRFSAFLKEKEQAMRESDDVTIYFRNNNIHKSELQKSSDFFVLYGT